jgi:Fic family protein
VIFEPPVVEEDERLAIARIAELRDRLRWAVAEPRRWLGGLRRTAFARVLQGSNSIEGYDAALDDVMAVLDNEEPLNAATETKLALQGYRDAMTYVLQLAEEDELDVDTNLIRSLHYMMLKHDLPKRPGRWRKGSIFVRRERGQVVVYEGPDIEMVATLMEEVAASIRASNDDPLVAGAMAHLNLAMVHPFADGNGRMARCLQTLVLARSRAVRATSPVFCSIEEWLGRNTEAYYAVLGEVGDGRWQPGRDARPWLRFCLNAHHQQALTQLWRVRASEELWERCADLAATKGVPIRSVGALCDAARGLRVRNASYRTAVRDADEGDITLHTASSDLRILVRAGLLVAKGETRGRYYIGSDTLRDEYAAIRSSQPKPEMFDLFDPFSPDYD